MSRRERGEETKVQINACSAAKQSESAFSVSIGQEFSLLCFRRFVCFGNDIEREKFVLRLRKPLMDLCS